MKLYRDVLAEQPNRREALLNLGMLLLQTGAAEHAIDELRRAVELAHDDVAGWSILGAALKDSGDNDGSIACARKMIELSPQMPVAHLNLGIALAEDLQYEAALAPLRRAIELEPNNPFATDTLGRVLKELGCLAEAQQSHRRTIALLPSDPVPRVNLANALLESGQAVEALREYEHAARILPDNPYLFSNVVTAMNYLPSATPQQIFARHCEWAARFEAPFRSSAAPHQNDRSPQRRVRVGFHASFYQGQPVTHFLQRVLENIDHANFETIFYSTVRRRDDITRRFDAFADRGGDIANVSDEQAERIIRDDRIDILIDLTGHFEGNRLPLFVRRPAPVQVTWLGYPNTTGLHSIDYRITDAHADPPGMTEPLHTERLIPLACAWCYAPPENMPEFSPLPGAADRGITFGSFNTLAKLTPGMIAIWSQVLHATPNSRLLIKAAGASDKPIAQRLLATFAGHNIAADRVQLRGRDAKRSQHLQTYRDVDIMLDTFPYHGTTMTCEAMWMGIPVITLAGQTHASRVGVSLLNTVGVGELIASSADDYVSIASRLAADRERLARLRASLRDTMATSRLCDGRAAAREFEAALRQMWVDWCRHG